jgi:metal-responsive CopG/Arc/MetJ family transcriptional regulator
MVIWKMMRNINLYLPEELLVEIDEAAKRYYMSRSAYIRHILSKAIEKRDPRDKHKPTGKEPWLYDMDDS